MPFARLCAAVEPGRDLAPLLLNCDYLWHVFSDSLRQAFRGMQISGNPLTFFNLHPDQ